MQTEIDAVIKQNCKNTEIIITFIEKRYQKLIALIILAWLFTIVPLIVFLGLTS